MLKKTALTLLTFGITGIACAAEYPIPPDLPSEVPVFYQPPTVKHGFYVGLGIGALDLSNKMTLSVDDIVNGNTVLDSSASTSNNNIGVNGILDLGYSWRFTNKLFFGIEGFGNLTSAETSQSVSKTQTAGNYTGTISGTDDFKWKDVYGARVLPGIQVSSHSVLYGIVGYARANAELANSSNTSNVTDTATGASQNLSTNGNLQNTYNFNGYQLGLGTMIDLVPNLALRADFIYSGYSSQTLGTHTESFENGTASTSISAAPYTMEGDLSLVYMFG